MKKLQYDPNYINMPLNNDTLFYYSVRTLLQRVVRDNLSDFKGVLLDLACGSMPYKQYILDNNKNITEYIGVDVNYVPEYKQFKADLEWNGKIIPREDSSVDTIITTEFFEHIDNLEEVLLEARRVLKKEGVLFFTIPFIWPLHVTPHDQYRYTPYSLIRMLKKAGFENIHIGNLGGHHAALAQMICIWKNNYGTRLGSEIKRNFFDFFSRIVLVPIVSLLMNRDKGFDRNYYEENFISPGWYGKIKK